MKYVVTWESRANASEELQARSLQVFSKWSPAEGTDLFSSSHGWTGGVVSRL
jgi:hypothetical protein